MPSTSGAQHRLMEMVAHGGKPSSGKGPPVSVAKEFVAADKAAGKSFPKNHKHNLPRMVGRNR